MNPPENRLKRLTECHLGGIILIRPRLVDWDISLRKEAFVLPQQFVHYTNADASREAHLFIEFHINIRELAVARGFRRPFSSPDRHDQCSRNDDGGAEIRPIRSTIVSGNFHLESIGEE